MKLKVYCKKDLIGYGEYSSYHKGSFYMANNIVPNWYDFEGSLHHMPSTTFDKYFITLKESRKLKLENINKFTKFVTKK